MSPALAQERFALVVEGAPGEAKYAEQHAAWREKLAKILRETYKIPEQQLVVLEGSGREAPATAGAVRAALQRFSAAMRPADIALIVLIGHGTFDGQDAKFNLVGPDLSAREWKALIDTLPGEVVFVNTASASSPFIAALAGPRRVVITATAIPAQRFHTTFAEYFIDGLAQSDADIDRNGRRSVFEAFAYASLRVRQHYEQRGQLATERALLDDDGDGKGRESGGEGTDGERASLAYLDADRAAIVTDPDLLRLMQRRDGLLLELEELKKRRLMMPPLEYDGLLEKLLIDLALVSRDIRART
ncbi:MAG TPA: hypothetical protein VMN81_02395 [Vicinamibacterales bacterium]|nr:hypothetical protein [Vicinamibacterales bacterium]